MGTNVVLYTDHTTFINVCNNVNIVKNLTDNTIADVSNWFRASGFLLNDDKTEVLQFSLIRFCS